MRCRLHWVGRRHLACRCALAEGAQCETARAATNDYFDNRLI